MNSDGLGCGCATCRGAATPATISNRPGLSEIAYRSGRHGDFLSAMLEALPTGDGSALARLRTRQSDDPTIALLDAFAVTCDVLTFYTERLANESYLLTATERTSLQELGALVAYRLGRGAAASTMLAFTAERPPALPSRDGQDPGVIPPAVPQRIVLPVGLRVQSVPGPGEQPQTFETIEEIEARPEWNALPVVRTVRYHPDGSTQAWLDGDLLRLAAGDPLLISRAGTAGFRLLTAADAHQDVARTSVDWPDAFAFALVAPAEGAHLAARTFRRRVPVFGHNAAQWSALSEQFRLGYAGEDNPADLPDDWPGFAAVEGIDNGVGVDLDGAYPDIVPGSWVVLSREGGKDGATRRVFEVATRAELSRSEFAVSGRITRLRLRGPHDVDWGNPRGVVVHAVSERLTLTEVPDPSPVDSADLVVEGDAGDMRAGRAVLLVGTVDGTPAAEELRIASAVRSGARTRLTLTAAPTSPFDRATAVVFGNAAAATHGETVGQLLGSGDARVPFAAATLAQGPLTFVPAPTPRGTASTLEVRVGDVAWTEVPTTAVSAARDRVFMTRDEPDGGLTVVFGDGEHGARPATGLNNLRARYRVGTGTAGNVAADALSMPLDRPLGLKAVTNPLAADGGVDPEGPDAARRSIPVPVRTLGRVVSLRDYADFALAFTGIGMAQAVLLPWRGGPLVVVSVADASGLPPAAAIVERLDDELTDFGDPSARHTVVACRQATFRLGLGVTIDPDRTASVVLAAVEAALRDAYSAPSLGIGRTVHASAVTAVAASVPGVDAIDLDLLYRGDLTGLRQRLVPRPAVARPGRLLGAEILSLSPDPFDRLEVRP